jgi:hypothetical protein
MQEEFGSAMEFIIITPMIKYIPEFTFEYFSEAVKNSDPKSLPL